jgi:DNA (cytosine-5)-methyltransferase 1
VSYAEKLIERLGEAGYVVEPELLDAKDFGVPQRRQRLFFLGVSKRLQDMDFPRPKALFQELKSKQFREDFARKKRLDLPVHVREAISDLETRGKGRRRIPHSDKGFSQLEYHAQHEALSAYQRLMREEVAVGETMTSMRLANHSTDVTRRFVLLQTSDSTGPDVRTTRNVGEAERIAMAREGVPTRKHRIHVLSKSDVSPTLTTLPDDIIHYSEPRILTVRESARLQSFPDWFRFTGKYTTGGNRRRKECPRYTQVGNAVPPLLAEAIGWVLRRHYMSLTSGIKSNCAS